MEDDLYIADKWNHRIRRVDFKTQVINTVMGRYLVENYLPTGEYLDGYIPDGTKVKDAELSYPSALAFDSKGNMYVSISDFEYANYGTNPGYKIIKATNPIPACPTDLTADYSYADGKHNAMLTWNAPANTAGITGYHVYRDGVLAINKPHVNGITQYTQLSILANCREYCFKITAFNAQGVESPDCAEICVTTSDVYRPVKPTGLTATAISGSEVELNWLPTTDTCDPESALSYNVYRDGVYIGETSDTTYTDLGLTDCPWIYTYKVSASDTSGNESVRSDPATVDMPDVTPPSVPAATATPVSGSAIALAWDASADNCDDTSAIVYNIYRDGNYLTTVSGTSYTDSGLADCTTYSYVMSAQDSSGNVSAVSAPATAKTLDVTAPAVPQGLTASATDGTSIMLNWLPSADECEGTAAGYNVYAADGTLAGTTASTMFTVAGLNECTTYCYYVTAFDTSNNVSGASGAACAKTPAVIGWDGGAGGKCGGTYNVSSAVTVEFALTRGGTAITDADIAGLTPRLYYKTAGGLVPVDPNVIGSKLEMFKYTNNGTWKVIIHTCAPNQSNCDGMTLIPGEYVIVAELSASGNAVCEYVMFGSQPTCGFTLTEGGGGGGGNGNGNGGGKK
ncbi:MAG: hypothetical protein HZA22_06450 [Nitrospirae bacterium]|nr:hypothetical protein [Nitrospirota bacterium]